MDDMLSQVEPMIPALRRYARGLLGEQDAADDIVQDCLEKVVANWHKRRHEDARSWMFTILHNIAINRVRQRSRRAPAVPLDDLSEARQATAATQEQALHSQDVMTAIKRLAPDQRSILLLISVEDLTYAEAAKVLDVPIGTVMSRLSRAREKLRMLLEDIPSGAISNSPICGG